MQTLSYNNIYDIRYQFNVCRSYQQFGECHNQYCVYLHPQNLHNNQEQGYYNNNNDYYDPYDNNSGYNNENYDPYNYNLENENQYQEYPNENNQYPPQNNQMPFQERNFGNTQQKVNVTPHKKITVIKRNNPPRNK